MPHGQEFDASALLYDRPFEHGGCRNESRSAGGRGRYRACRARPRHSPRPHPRNRRRSARGPDGDDRRRLRLDESAALQPLRDDRSLALHGALDEFRPDLPRFSQTYYISRLPWIVPGYLFNGIFDDARTAALVLHTTYFLGGGVLFYVLCRRWLGMAAAAIGYVALIGCQMYFDAHRWDYQEGGVLTYMIGTYAFSLVRTRLPLLRAASLALGGFFAAAMVTTRIIDAAYLVGLPLLSIAVSADLPSAVRLRQFGRDVAAFAAGAGALLVACG